MLKCELLAKSHNRREFDCGDMALNVFLQQFAHQQGRRNLSKTYVMIASENPSQILGFYSRPLSKLNLPRPLFTKEGRSPPFSKGDLGGLYRK